MKKTLKKIGNVIIDILVILILVISLTVVVMSVTSRQNGLPSLYGYVFLSVETDSMEPTIKAGDLIIGRASVSDADYEVGDVITFRSLSNGQMIYNTHRIVEKRVVNDITYYSTKGDNSVGQDDGSRIQSDIYAKWEGKRIPILGKVLSFLRTGIGFFIFLFIPVVIFFLYFLYKFIKNLSLYNKDKAVEAAKEAAKKTVTDATEEQKKKIIAEYLATHPNVQIENTSEDENKQE